ncbi:MAG: hypothetical protein ACO1SX_06705 [Actinomycetota bacterium]
MAALQPYTGRRCVFIEDGVFSVARVVEVGAAETGMEAVLEAVPELPLVCHYRKDPPRFAEEPHPVGSRWEINRTWEWFYPGEEIWDESPYSGFRILFASEVLERFLARDLSWVEEYF